MNELIAVSAIAIMLLVLAVILGVVGFLLLTVGVVVVKLKQVRR